ncbi:MAG: methylated-DNA--[protein]-cysteine S-methyltransferase [Paludibacteraceae bacterium]|nr:methylated-DNA--[protein]-cysteine S-methyltransferase [Paludibacteraceae bacterium]
MQFVSRYLSPLGLITLACDEVGLVGLWFDGQKFFGSTLLPGAIECDSPVLNDAAHWLDDYFRGFRPSFIPSLSLNGSNFRLAVWNLLQDIPYGQTTTYKALAQCMARNEGKNHMSAQAVGGAVGHNPVSIIVPCHRVLAVNGALTGYAGGLERKAALLELEGVI